MRIDEELEIWRDDHYFINLYHVMYIGSDVGFFTFLKMGNSYYINQFEIDMHFRNKYIGTRVYRFFERELVPYSIQKIECASIEDAVGFWEKMGFTQKNDESVMMKCVNEISVE
jgi:hypothetical protein